MIYEPPQEGTEVALILERSSAEEKRADELAQLLGIEKVAWGVAEGCDGVGWGGVGRSGVESDNGIGRVTKTKKRLVWAALQCHD